MHVSSVETVFMPIQEAMMHAMLLKKIGSPLEWRELADPEPGSGEIRVRVSACGVCRTDLHVVDGELPDEKKKSIVCRHDSLGARQCR